jgi:nucleolar MIF4G domain-containing protein 1
MLTDDRNFQDDSRGPPLLKWKGRTSVQRGDRKDQRKLQRQEKKSRNYQQTKRGSVQSHNDGRKDESDVEDPFGISDASDIDFVKEPPAPKLNTQKNPNPESEPEPEPLKSILKPTLKRKATGEEPEPETKSELPKKKTLSKGVRDRLAQDEAEIEYLEKKLKIKNKKIPTSFEEDGLDFLLGDLKDDYLDSRLQKVVWINRTENLTFNDEGDENDTDHLDRDIFYGSEPDEKGVHENDEFHGFSDTEISDRSLEEPTEESQEPLQALPKIRENPYKPPSAEKSVGKYIPPSLRKPADTESEQLVRLRRQIQGRINRLSEANLISILGDVETVYRTHPRGDVTHILTDILLNTLCDPSVLMDTYHILHGGFLAGLYKIMGVDVGANVVQRIVEEFMKHHDRVNGIVEPSTSGKECTNLISFLSELYNFQVVSCVLIFDLIRMFLDELTELHTELLLKVVRSLYSPPGLFP